MSELTVPIATAIIAQERYPTRFEKFCNDLIGQHEGGVTIVSTSASWDLGRDGRGTTKLGMIYTCCSLRDDVDDKAKEDIRRLAANLKQKPYRVYFCSSQSLSEKTSNNIEAELTSIDDNQATIIPYGKDHLAELSIRYPEALEHHYKSELDSLRAALTVGPGELEAEEVGLRMALVASSGNDTVTIRNDLYTAGLRLVFKDKKPRNTAEVARDLAGLLHLQRSIPTDIVTTHVLRLCDMAELVQRDSRYFVTDEGIKAGERLDESAADKLLAGRQYIRERLERAVGQKFPDEQFAIMWNAIQELTTHHFYTRGQQIVSDISSLLEEGGVKEEVELSMLPFIEDLAIKTAACSEHAQQREEIRQAIKDLFTERSGPAFDWLVRLCLTFVGACSLGLEATVGAAISKLLKRITLVLDTDVVLSLLSEGEVDHECVDAIVSRWRALGGAVMVGRPVLQEAAHHAWIAEHDYREVGHILPGTEEDRIRYISNAFVRGFGQLLAIERATRRHWGAYIRQYKGTSPNDTKPIAAILQADHGVSELRGRGTRERELELRVAGFLIEHVHRNAVGPEVHNLIDKAKRDAKLYASIVSEIKLERKSDPGATCLLVSSARRLIDVEKRFREIKDTHIVIPIPMALYLISLIPQVSLGMGAMKAFLFDERIARFSSDLERTLLRVVRASTSVSMPFAKRGALMREVREKLLRDARQAGLPTRTAAQRDGIEAAALEKGNLPKTMEILLQSLDAVAATSTDEEARQHLVRRIVELERELERARRDGRPAGK